MKKLPKFWESINESSQSINESSGANLDQIISEIFRNMDNIEQLIDIGMNLKPTIGNKFGLADVKKSIGRTKVHMDGNISDYLEKSSYSDKQIAHRWRVVARKMIDRVSKLRADLLPVSAAMDGGKAFVDDVNNFMEWLEYIGLGGFIDHILSQYDAEYLLGAEFGAQLIKTDNNYELENIIIFNGDYDRIFEEMKSYATKFCKQNRIKLTIITTIDEAKVERTVVNGNAGTMQLSFSDYSGPGYKFDGRVRINVYKNIKK